MVTDEDRANAILHARLRGEFHRRHGDRSKRRSLRLSDDEVTRRGLLGESAFANRFGERVDYGLHRGGDGGRDFWLRARTRDGIADSFQIDVKTSTVRTTWATVAGTTYLRVPCRDIRPRVIYVAAIYLERTDDAEVLCWQWGQTLIDRNERRRFDTSDLNYIQLFKDCRALEELEERAMSDPLGTI